MLMAMPMAWNRLAQCPDCTTGRTSDRVECTCLLYRLPVQIGFVVDVGARCSGQTHLRRAGQRQCLRRGNRSRRPRLLAPDPLALCTSCMLLVDVLLVPLGVGMAGRTECARRVLLEPPGLHAALVERVDATRLRLFATHVGPHRCARHTRHSDSSAEN